MSRPVGDEHRRTDPRTQSIREVVEQCRRQRSRGESVSEDSVIQKLLDLMPELAEALEHLRLLEAVRCQVEKGKAVGEGSMPQGEQAAVIEGLWVRCPHCHSSMKVFDEATFADIDCASCGSRFALACDERSTDQATTALQCKAPPYIAFSPDGKCLAAAGSRKPRSVSVGGAHVFAQKCVN